MECRKCNNPLAEAKHLFFYVKTANEIHLALKPECRAVLEADVFVRVVETKKRVRIKCKKCLENVGVDVPYGPNGTSFIGFGPEKVILGGEQFASKKKWSDLMLRFRYLERRNMDNFFGIQVESKTEATKQTVKKKPEKGVLKFAMTAEDFEWYSLAPMNKVPRNYQIEAYIEALQQDLVVVIDTGLGKTLIASMVIARMKVLNPNHMAVMLVDRIPLVFQQGQSVMNDTGIRVCSMCSENRTTKRIKQLHDGTYDALVITAGAFLELINREQIKVTDFCVIVFDECHHATGDHVYAQILRLLEMCPQKTRPRVLGLTASPFRVENHVKGKNQLQKFRKCFLNAAFFYPEIKKPKKTAQQVTIRRSYEQDRFISDALERIRETVSMINMFVTSFCNDQMMREANLYRLKGQVKALRDEYPESGVLEDIVKEVILLIDIIEICNLLGVKHAVSVLADMPKLSHNLDILHRKHIEFADNVASRLMKLEELLRNSANDMRAIVFVQTQNTAQLLFQYLVKTFPTLHPKIVLGHGGYHGMSWDEEQKPAIKDFKQGKTNLLVATSVLEEGLDVSECDLVVRYSGPNTLINFIQSRGRARKPGSQFFVFIDQSQLRSVQDLESQEQVLKNIINVEGSKDCLPSMRSKRIKQQLESNHPERVARQVNFASGQISKDDGKKSMALQFFVRMGQEDETISSEFLVNEIEESAGIFTVQRFIEINKSAEIASGTAGIFSSNDKSYLLSVKSDMDDLELAFEHFCKLWNFTFETSTISFAWCKREIRSSIRDARLRWEPLNVQFGKFTCRQTFESEKTVCKRSDDDLILIADEGPIVQEFVVFSVEFNPARSILFYFVLEGLDLKLEIPLTEINNFALLSFEANYPCLYIPLHSSPFVFILEDTIKGPVWKRTCNARILDDLPPECSVIAITFEPSSWSNLSKTLSCPELMPVPVFNTHVKQENLATPNNINDRTVQRLEKSLQSRPDGSLQKCLWVINALKARRNICVPNGDLLFLLEQLERAYDKGNTELFEIAITQVYNHDSFYWLDIQSNFTRIFANLQQLPPAAISFVKTPLPADHVMVKRIVVTPSRIVCLPETPVASSRLLRCYGDKYEFVIVSFKEEQFQKLQGTDTLNRINNIMEHGMKIGGKHYLFFCSSASQLRDHKAYFIAAEAYQDVQSLRSEIVKNKDSFKSTAKYMSRLSLFATSDKPMVNISSIKMSLQPDIKARNGDLVTDGCGKISNSFAKRIAEELDLEDNIPSAFQIRISGIKGVAVVVDDGDCDSEISCDNDFIFRESMIKFDNTDSTLCIVTTARYNNVFLNHEAITLLTSLNEWMHKRTAIRQSDSKNWMVERTIAELHENALCDAASIFEDISAARIGLMEYLPQKVVNHALKSGFDILSEPFWFSLLQNVYRVKATALRTKARVPVEKGALLMGVADPTGLLKDDEIFVQIQKEEGGPCDVITGDVLIYRNPCLHPGDLRWVKAVNHPSLKQWKNVVILPTKNVDSSLAAECSGGDLDGDNFSLIWDERFIPCDDPRYPSLDYTDLAKGAPEDFDSAREQSLFASFFTRVVANDSLGRVAHTHLALSDHLSEGACEHLAVELSKSQSQAVDFPKTGIIPLVPEAALLSVKDTGYPDFMEKGEGSMVYFSEKLLGVLYRRCRSLMFDFDIATEKRRGYNLNFDMDLILDGHKDFIDDALKKFATYEVAFKAVMVHFSLKREAEVVLARPLVWNPLLKGDKGKVCKAIKASYDALVKKYRDEFFKDVVADTDMRRKASAWYRVGYDLSLRKKGTTNLYSFAWIVDDILCAIKKEKQQTNTKRPSAVLLRIGESVHEEFLNASFRLESVIAAKEDILKCIKSEIERVAGKECFTVTAYGSVSMYLCEQESDLDVCLSPCKAAYDKYAPKDSGEFMELPLEAQAKHFLDVIISKAVDSIVHSKTHKLTKRVPLISIQVGESDDPTNVDLSFNRIGRLKTECMLEIYDTKPTAFLVLWLLVKWARSNGLIKSGAEKKESRAIEAHTRVRENTSTSNNTNTNTNTLTEGLIAAAEFYVLVIDLLELKSGSSEESKKSKSVTKGKSRRKKKPVTLQKLANSASRAKQEEKVEVGEMIVAFFRRGAAIQNEIELKWPNPDIPSINLSSEVAKIIATHCMNGLHCILATRDVGTMLSYVRDANDNQTTFSKKLPSPLARAIGKAASFHAARLASNTGAKIEISETSQRMILTATGTRSAIMKLKEELHELSVTNRALMLGRMPKKTSRYFMEGATLIVMRGNSSPDAMVFERGLLQKTTHTDEKEWPIKVSFEKTIGPWNMLHHVSERHRPTLCSEASDDWLEGAVGRISNRIMQQMNKFPVKNSIVLGSLSISLMFGSCYTVDISRSLPISQPTESVQNLELRIEKGRRNRKNWQRGEFTAPPDDNKAPPASLKQIHLSPIKGHDGGVRSRQKPTKNVKKDSKKNSVTASFCNGLLAENNRNPSVSELSRTVYVSALEECGFSPGSNGYSREKIGWKVHSLPSSSYEAVIRLDAKSNFLEVHERALKWLSVNFLDVDTQETNKGLMVNSDFRFNIITKDPVRHESDLFKKVVPKPHGPMLDTRSGKPVMSSEYPEQSKSYISMIREVKEHLGFCKEDYDANITIGIEYRGKDLRIERRFCDLSITFNPERLRNLLISSDGLNSSDCRDIATELSKTGIEISDAVKQKVKNLE